MLKAKRAELDLAFLLASNVFDMEDLAHNRRSAGGSAVTAPT
jgi:hypothetical protein